MALPSLTLLRRGFVDVCNGYSVGHIVAKSPEGPSKTIYIRHLGHREHACYEDVQASFEDKARADGAQTETQRLETLYAKGQWSPERETSIKQQRDFIERLEDGRKTIAVPSVLQSHEERIGREKVALVKVLTDRAQAIGMTVETYAQRRLEDYYLVHNLFVDSELITPLFTSDDFDNLKDDEVEVVQNAYNKAIEPCSDANLRRLAVQDFFVSYYTLCADDAAAFYGKPICELTYYQVRLANLARYMKVLMDNTDMSRLTPAERLDPDVIEQKHITQKNMAAMQAKGETPVGLSAAEMKESGQQYSAVPPVGVSGVELVKWLRKNQR